MKTTKQSSDKSRSQHRCLEDAGITNRRTFLHRLGLGLGGALLAPQLDAAKSDGARPRKLIGYTEYRANLPSGRHANVITMRACVVKADGTGHHRLAEALTRKPNTWTQFAGWSPDGRMAVIGSGWESPENAAWEEEHKTFRFTDQGWLYDMVLLNMSSGKLKNVTAAERVSYYNSGLLFWKNDPNKLGFQALIDGNSHPFSMDLDGRNKKDLTENSKEFSYGFSTSPDGKQISYHKNYQVFIADADGANARQIQTGQQFNFSPQWSPDGQWLMFVSGEHYNCHPCVVRRDGSGFRKVADRGGHKGVVEFLDVPDFHGGSSDVPVWSPDGTWIYFTAKLRESIELMRASLDGRVEQLSRSRPGELNYHPKLSPDGQWMVFGSNRSGARQLYVCRPDGSEAKPITRVKPGWGAMWAYWQE